MGEIVRAGGSVTISGAALLAQTYRAVLDGIARRRRDGYPTHDLLELARALRAAHAVSLERRKVATPGASSTGSNGQDLSDRLSVAEAANILRLSKRQVQRLAKSPGGLSGVRAGRIWSLDRAPVLALAERRARRDRTDGLPGRVEAI
jgi:excisionase family DNA binding protein